MLRFDFLFIQTVEFDPKAGEATPREAPTPYAGAKEASVRWEDFDGKFPTLDVGQSALLYVNGEKTAEVTLVGITSKGDPLFRLQEGPTFVTNVNVKDYGTEKPFPVETTGGISCFLGGTLIATPQGERPVESLAIGDLVLTADGRAVPVLWLGRQVVRNHPLFMPARREPVCISAGALGQGLPHTDLHVSADHGMLWEGLVVNAGALVNGRTIRFAALAGMPAEFTYFHIETPAHEAVLANGAPAETFVDYVTRRNFDNYQEYLDLYGAERVVAEMPRPRISAQRMLPDALRAKLGLGRFGAGQAQERDALLRRLGAAEAAWYHDPQARIMVQPSLTG